jgi:hypothetical protein
VIPNLDPNESHTMQFVLPDGSVSPLTSSCFQESADTGVCYDLAVIGGVR